LLISAADSRGMGLCNPSVFIDHDEIWLILRHTNYILYHCENRQTFNSRWGPLSYLNPENDPHLRTTNYLCKLTPDLDIERYWKIDTSARDKEPLWEFVGLEDARLVRWDGHLYGIGVRRDTTVNGQGRMEFSEIELKDGTAREIGRYRIEHPVDPNWYCEKNWMPIIDMPYHFVQWTNPAIVVKADLATLKSWHAREPDEADKVENMPFLRGSSQVVPWRDYRVCLVHDCDLFKNCIGQKDATYMHRFVVYDRDWDIVRIGEPFSFLDGEIEFCCGMAIYKDDMLISFGFQDNCAFILRVPAKMIPEVLGVPETPKPKKKWRRTKYPTLEITTAMPPGGCPLKCAFCPQDKVIAAYSDRLAAAGGGDRVLSWENFVKVMEKIPQELQVTFSGFAEPFLNPHCAAMVEFAYSAGHRVNLFTTAVGMKVEDVERIRHIPFWGIQGGFMLHLPDEEGYFAHKLTEDYLRTLEVLSKAQISNLQCVTMGTLPARLRELFPNTWRPRMHDRAGNLVRIDLDAERLERKSFPATCGCQERLYRSIMLPNGDVTLCCMDWSLQHVLGNLYESSFEDVVPVDHTAFELCRHCENGVPA
jgi:hypothetical protein